MDLDWPDMEPPLTEAEKLLLCKIYEAAQPGIGMDQRDMVECFAIALRMTSAHVKA